MPALCTAARKIGGIKLGVFPTSWNEMHRTTQTWLLGALFLAPTAAHTAVPPKPKPKVYKKIGTAKPALPVPTNAPNLEITKLEEQGYSNDFEVVVENTGQTAAVFPDGGRLLSTGLSVPAGGRVEPGASYSETFSPHWTTFECPASADTDTLEGGLVTADPDKLVLETSEANSVKVTRDNPFKTDELGTGKPDLRVVSAYATRFANSTTGNLYVTVKNFGSGIAWACDQGGNANGMTPKLVAGKIPDRSYTSRMSMTLSWKTGGAVQSPIRVLPGETINVFFGNIKYAEQEFGVWSEGYQPGCYSFNATVDPDALVDETNECNNITTVHFTIGEATCSETPKVINNGPSCQKFTPGRKRKVFGKAKKAPQPLPK